MKERPPLRVGAVSYLNTKPLIYGLSDRLPSAWLTLDYPSRLADRLAAGTLDIALIPVVEFFRQHSLGILSDACIACRGPVWSVKVFFRVPPAEVQTLALDEGSRTSAVLAQLLLHARCGRQPKLLPLPVGQTVRDTQADAVLLIGDRAMNAQPGPFADVWDLGDQWCRWSERPFVFALWAARPEIADRADAQSVSQALSACRDEGVAQIERIAAAEASALGLTQPECIRYLRHNLHFQFGNHEQAGLELFRRSAAALGLVPPAAKTHLPASATDTTVPRTAPEPEILSQEDSASTMAVATSPANAHQAHQKDLNKPDNWNEPDNWGEPSRG